MDNWIPPGFVLGGFEVKLKHDKRLAPSSYNHRDIIRFFQKIRIIRAFLIEEQKIVVKVLKAQQAAEKAAAAATEGGKKKKKSGKAKK